MSGIFISYRRRDAQSASRSLAERLEEAFGKEAVFRDIEAIAPGADFVDAIGTALNSSVALLAVIGPRWLTATDDQGRRRLDDPGDYTRLEISTALARGLRVIPVLVEGAAMPSESDLPDDLKPLARRQGHEITDKRWDYDTGELIAALAKLPGLTRRTSVPPAQAQSRTARPMLKWVIAGIVAVGAVGVVVDQFVIEDVAPDLPAPTPAPVPAPEPQAQPRPPSQPPVVESAAPSPADVRPATPPPAEVRPATPQPPAVRTQPAPAAAPDLSGRWRDSDGFVYVVQQQGATLRYRVFEETGAPAGEGMAEVRGNQLSAVTYYSQGGAAYTYRSQLTISPDGRSMTGFSVEPTSGAREPVRLVR